MMEYVYDESVQVCDDQVLRDKTLNKRPKTYAPGLKSAFLDSSASESENSDIVRGRRTMAAHEQEVDYDGHNSNNGQVVQEKVERPITRGTRQKTANQQSNNGRPGTGKNAPGSSRPRPPSPEPSETVEDEVQYDELGHPPIEGVARKRKQNPLIPRNLHYNYGSDDEGDRDFLNITDYTNMSSMEFSKMLTMLPENLDVFPDYREQQQFPYPESESEMMEEQGMHNSLAERQWMEKVIERKREELRNKAKCTRNPGIHGIRCGGMYNAEDYANLNTSPEIKQLFEYITTYLPSANMTPEVKFKPFIREYEASVGDIDAFLKVVHPEITNDGLGIKVLDEPSAFQSDPSVLDLRLRAMAKQSSAKAIVVKKVENAHKNPKIIDNWIKDISDLHRSKPSPSVHYSKPMPDIDLLLQEWPPEFEELLKSVTTPTAQLDCDLKTYVDLVCNVLDIPVYKSRIQSLHVLATLYATHKNFNNYGPSCGPAAGGGNESMQVPSASNSFRVEDNLDRMEF